MRKSMRKANAKLEAAQEYVKAYKKPKAPKREVAPEPAPISYRSDGFKVDSAEIKKLGKGHFFVVVTCGGKRIEIQKRFKSITRAKEWIAWLEKKGEQKSIWYNEGEEPQRGSLILLIMQSGTPIVAKIIEPNHTFNHGERWAYIDDLVEKRASAHLADSVGPKFHEGEWLCENEPNNYARFIQILEIVNVQGKERYRISRDIHNDEDIVQFDFVEKHYHKFGIQDAQDGDVLASGEVVFAFKMIHGVWLNCHCSAHKDGSFNADSYDLLTNKYFGEVYPATKEQRDFLFKKMDERSRL